MPNPPTSTLPPFSLADIPVVNSIAGLLAHLAARALPWISQQWAGGDWWDVARDLGPALSPVFGLGRATPEPYPVGQLSPENYSEVLGRSGMSPKATDWFSQNAEGYYDPYRSMSTFAMMPSVRGWAGHPDVKEIGAATVLASLDPETVAHEAGHTWYNFHPDEKAAWIPAMQREAAALDPIDITIWQYAKSQADDPDSPLTSLYNDWSVRSGYGGRADWYRDEGDPRAPSFWTTLRTLDEMGTEGGYPFNVDEFMAQQVAEAAKGNVNSFYESLVRPLISSAAAATNPHANTYPSWLFPPEEPEYALAEDVYSQVPSMLSEPPRRGLLTERQHYNIR